MEMTQSWCNNYSTNAAIKVISAMFASLLLSLFHFEVVHGLYIYANIMNRTKQDTLCISISA